MKTLAYIAIVCFLISCSTKQNRLVRVWLYNEEPTEEQIAENDTYGRSAGSALTAANFIDLQPDSTYSSYLSSFEHGKWYFKHNNLILVNQKKQLFELVVNKVSEKEMICTDKMKGIVYRFNGEPNHFETPAENPFSPQNNQWRVKAKHKESEAALRARLKNHFSFWENYFAWGLKNKIQYLDVRSTPSLLKMYGNGFELEYYDNLFPEWKNSFYDTADCRMAYENLYYKMYEKNIQWPDTKNRFERFVSAFDQLQNWMDEKMSPYVGKK
ncbi:MAG TPA: hypothetical protein VFS22_09705 [Flavisolibacter sp.]|nr:hypothetical protein [Flavisolibacter sp.]